EAQLAPQAATEKSGAEQAAAGSAKTQTTETGKPIEGVTSRLTRNADGDSLLLVDAGFDKVWPLLEPALKELGFTIDDSSRGAQVITVSKVLPTVRFDEQAPHPADEEPEVKEEYQIHLETADDKTRVTVHNKFGTLESSGLSEHLLLQISEIIKNPKAKKAG
ncbi:MAG: outer membrane protein assembly factor BamC, partial [Gammaproteobacteria bacterium]